MQRDSISRRRPPASSAGGLRLDSPRAGLHQLGRAVAGHSLHATKAPTAQVGSVLGWVGVHGGTLWYVLAALGIFAVRVRKLQAANAYIVGAVMITVGMFIQIWSCESQQWGRQHPLLPRLCPKDTYPLSP